MVAEIVQLWMYVPFTLCGFALCTASMTARAFSSIALQQRKFADGYVDISGLINLELDSARFHFFDGATGVVGLQEPVFRIGHEARRSEDFCPVCGLRPCFQSRHSDVEISPAFLAFFESCLFKPNKFRARGFWPPSAEGPAL